MYKYEFKFLLKILGNFNKKKNCKICMGKSDLSKYILREKKN